MAASATRQRAPHPPPTPQHASAPPQDYDAAIKLLNEALLHSPEHFALYELRATYCLHAGRHEEALSDALRCTDLNAEWWAGQGGGGDWMRECMHSTATTCASPPAQPPSPPTPLWPLHRARGWARLGAAQLCCGHARAAVSAYMRAQELGAGGADVQRGLKLAQETLLRQGGRRLAQPHAQEVCE